MYEMIVKQLTYTLENLGFVNKTVLFMLFLITSFCINVSRMGRAGFTDVEAPGQSTFGDPY
jgi:hypothetical protein